MPSTTIFHGRCIPGRAAYPCIVEAMSTPVAAQRNRAEITALRACAVLLVVLYHLWPGRLPGGYIGVDVFFVISGFLITSHLLRESSSTGTIALGRFWARRARRLLPAAYLVLAATAVAVAAWMPVSTWQTNYRQIIASTLYVQNWVLAADSVDYLASDVDPAAAQHYWSLSIEEQFYLVWPLLILAAAVWARRRSSSPTTATWWAIGVPTAASLVFSLWITQANPPAAYFVTPARAWQFGAGGLLGLWFATPVEPPPEAGRAEVGLARCRPDPRLLGWVRGARLVRADLRRDHAVPGHGGHRPRRGHPGDHRRGRAARQAVTRPDHALAPRRVLRRHLLLAVPVALATDRHPARRARPQHGLPRPGARAGGRDPRGRGHEEVGRGPRPLHPPPRAAPPAHRTRRDRGGRGRARRRRPGRGGHARSPSSTPSRPRWRPCSRTTPTASAPPRWTRRSPAPTPTSTAR